MGPKPMTTKAGEVTRNGVLAWLGVLLVSSTMGQPQSDPLRLSKRSSMDLRLSKRTPTDTLLEFYIPETTEEDRLYESPVVEKRDNMLRLSKRDLLRLSKRDLIRLSKRDLLRLSKRTEEARNKPSYRDSNRDLRLSKRPEWSEVDWQPPLLDKKDKSEVPMVIRQSKRDLSRLLNEGSLEGAGRELRLSKRAFEVVN